MKTGSDSRTCKAQNNQLVIIGELTIKNNVCQEKKKQRSKSITNTSRDLQISFTFYLRTDKSKGRNLAQSLAPQWHSFLWRLSVLLTSGAASPLLDRSCPGGGLLYPPE